MYTLYILYILYKIIFEEKMIVLKISSKTMSKFRPLALDGNNIFSLIFSKHFIESRIVTNRIFFSPERPLFLHACATWYKIPYNNKYHAPDLIWYNPWHPLGIVPTNNSRIGVCVKPIHFNFNKTFQFIQFIELNMLLGVSRSVTSVPCSFS